MSTFNAAPTGTGITLGFNNIREDLENVVYKISPLECPVMQSIGRKGAFEQAYHEWPIVELAAPNASNAQFEGGDAVADAATLPIRLANYAQISTKVKYVSSTSDAARGAGDVQKMAKQILYATQEIKRDMESRIAGNGTYIASAAGTVNGTGGSQTAARTTASIAAFISALGLSVGNLVKSPGVTGYTAAAFSGTAFGTYNGYVNTAEVPGTTPTSISATLAASEASFKSAIQAAWTQGGNPTYAFVPGGIKISMSAFTGNSTRFKQAEDRKLVAAIDVYESDFGQLQIVPDRFMATDRVLILDPGYAEIGWLQPMKNEPLAKTGLSTKRMVSCEWGVVVGNPKAHAMMVGYAA